MALATPSCMMVEHKRDFDLSVVLDALKKATMCANNTNSPSDPDNSSFGASLSVDSAIAELTGCTVTVSANKLMQNSINANGNAASSGNTTIATNGSDSDIEHQQDYGAEATAAVQSCSIGSFTKVSDVKPEHSRIAMTECSDIKIPQYLEAFTELTRFFKLTGPVFAFVARDLTRKIAIVQSHVNSAESSEYMTLKCMIEYELKKGCVGNKGTSASGTRTMLRLHWALSFFIEFMDKLKDATEDTKSSTLVYDVYQQTLALHHPWWTRKLAYLAVFTLPSIKTLIEIMCKQDYGEVKILLAEIVAVGRPIVECTAGLYDLHNLSVIP